MKKTSIAISMLILLCIPIMGEEPNEVYNIKPGIGISEGTSKEEYQRYLEDGIPQDVLNRQNERYNEEYYGESYSAPPAVSDTPYDQNNSNRNDTNTRYDTSRKNEKDSGFVGFIKGIDVVGNERDYDRSKPRYNAETQPSRGYQIKGERDRSSQRNQSGVSFVDMVQRLKVENK